MDVKWWSRFNAKFKICETTKCWVWHGSKGRGYGLIYVNGKVRPAHLIAYELLVGLVPEGLELDHLCRNRACVNIDHLEPVTHKENVRRGITVLATREAHAKKTHCPQGHPYSGENLYVAPDGHRECRECSRESGRKYRAKKATSTGRKNKVASHNKGVFRSDVVTRKSYVDLMKENE